MLEMHLTAVFLGCVLFLLAMGVYAVKTAGGTEGSPGIIILLPVGKDTSDIEFVVRECVYKAAEEYPETVTLLCDLGADEDTLRIFEKLMQFSCSYYIVDHRR